VTVADVRRSRRIGTSRAGQSRRDGAGGADNTTRRSTSICRIRPRSIQVTAAAEIDEQLAMKFEHSSAEAMTAMRTDKTGDSLVGSMRAIDLDVSGGRFVGWPVAAGLASSS
jgi:hypothetical protein